MKKIIQLLPLILGLVLFSISISFAQTDTCRPSVCFPFGNTDLQQIYTQGNKNLLIENQSYLQLVKILTEEITHTSQLTTQIAKLNAQINYLDDIHSHLDTLTAINKCYTYTLLATSSGTVWTSGQVIMNNTLTPQNFSIAIPNGCYEVVNIKSVISSGSNFNLDCYVFGSSFNSGNDATTFAPVFSDAKTFLTVGRINSTPQSSVSFGSGQLGNANVNVTPIIQVTDNAIYLIPVSRGTHTNSGKEFYFQITIKRANF